MNRKISQEGIKLIKSFEGCRLTAYKPVSTEEYWTIGWGHYGSDVKKEATITQDEADDMLIKDLVKYVAYVNNPLYVPVNEQLTQNQFDALTSFCYNCGPGSLKTLCKGRTVAQIGDNITKYNKSSGTVLKGLVRRRKAEFELFNQVEDGGKIKVNKDDANKIIDTYLKPAWGASKTAAHKQEIGRLADVLRLASGQAKQNG